MSFEYIDFYKMYRNKVSPKILGIGITSKHKIESRIREIMEKAVALNNKELAQVACDLAADEIGSSSSLLLEMNAIWQKIESSEPESNQRTKALKGLR